MRQEKNQDNSILLAFLNSVNMVRFLFLLLAVILEEHALAKPLRDTQTDMEGGLQLWSRRSNAESRKLQRQQCPAPYVWVKPSWWRKYRLQMTKTILKKCKFLEGKIPDTGKKCLPEKEGVICMFGEARCNGVVEPERKCECVTGVWNCTTVCPNLKCPAEMVSSRSNCDPLVNVVVCPYNEHCCGDECYPTDFCRCETFQEISRWRCVSTTIPLCKKTSLEEAGCTCDRPIDGRNCTLDYACGSACCGNMAYTCKECNSSTGLYKNCGKTGIVPGPMETCECENPIQLAPSLNPLPRSFAADDLMVRFNKFSMPSTLLPANMSLPLMPWDYPLSILAASWLRKSDAISVVHEDDCWECKNAKISLSDLIASVGGTPFHPSRNLFSPYWAELSQVANQGTKRTIGRR
jgi:hypothetical protein